MKVKIDRDGCIGCGLCAATCPEVFRMADDGLAEVAAAPSPDVEDGAKEAADNCPVQVIETEDERSFHAAEPSVRALPLFTVQKIKR